MNKTIVVPEKKVYTLIDFCKEAYENVTGEDAEKAFREGNCGNLAEWIEDVFSPAVAVPFVGYNSGGKKKACNVNVTNGHNRHVFTQVGEGKNYDVGGIVSPKKWEFVEEAGVYLKEGHLKNSYGFWSMHSSPVWADLHFQYYKKHEQRRMDKVASMIHSEFVPKNWQDYAEYNPILEQEAKNPPPKTFFGYSL